MIYNVLIFDEEEGREIQVTVERGFELLRWTAAEMSATGWAFFAGYDGLTMASFEAEDLADAFRHTFRLVQRECEEA